MKRRVLVVDDERGVREALKQILEYEGITVKLAASGGEALTVYPEFRPNLVFLDVKMAGMDGLDTLGRLLDLDPGAGVVMISGHASVTTAVEATRKGAWDFLEKPLDSDRLLVTLRNAFERSKLTGENRRLRSDAGEKFAMVGDSAAMQTVRDVIARVAPSNARVLISGENGTGKELVARSVHEGSPRKGAPFVEVNCAAIPSELIESELFGHMKGSFTGAVSDRAGKFEQADGGTLFLDEVGDMAAPAQAKVLRALQEGVISRIGGSKAIQVDVRVIAATNKDLELEIREGRFREDLFYRLNVVPIAVPPLRERREDIPALVRHFVQQLSRTTGAGKRTISEKAIEALQGLPWSGNVRELRNAVERLLILAPGKSVTPLDVQRLLGDSLPGAVRSVPFHGDLVKYLAAHERQMIEYYLRLTGWNITATFEALGLSRSALYNRMSKLGLAKTRDGTPAQEADPDEEVADE